MKRLGPLFLAGILASLAVLVACAPAAPTPAKPAAKPADAKAADREAQFVAGAQKEGELSVLVYSMPEKDKVTAQFKAKYPFLNVSVFDAEGPEIIVRLQEEIKAGRVTADVIYITTEIVKAHELGLLDEYDWPNTKDWTVKEPGHNFYRPVFGQTRLFVYNKDKVPASDVPKAFEDLLDPKYQKYRFAASTSGEDSPLLWAAMWGGGQQLNWDKSEKYWGDLGQRYKLRVERGFTGPTELLGAGEFDFLLPAPGATTLRALSQGAPIGVAPMPEYPNFIGAFIGLVKGSPHPNAARLWADFYTTPEGWAAYGNATRSFAIQGGEYEKVAEANKAIGSAAPQSKFVPLASSLILNEPSLERSEQFWYKMLGVGGRT